jgi:LPXTG-motif cell wall-anchored protein
MKKIRGWLGGIVLLTALVCLFVPSALATPPAPVDIESFSVGDVITAQIVVYDATSKHITYEEDPKEARIFYKRQGMADPGKTLRLVLTAKQSLPGTAQEAEITMQPYEEMNRYAGKKLERFHRKVKGTEGKKLDVSIKYDVPDKTRLLIATLQLKDYYKKEDKVLPRYTTVEYEFRMIGFAEASANPLRNKKVTTVRDKTGKRMIIEDKGTDVAVAAVGIGIPVLAALGYWVLRRRKKK